MGLFSFLRKNQQTSTSREDKFYSRAEEESRVKSPETVSRKRKASNEAVAPLLPQKKRARRRLIGAIALVLTAVIGLPMIFDSEPKRLSDDIDIQIPSKEKPLPTMKLPSSGSPASATLATKVPATAALDPQEEILEVPALSPSVEPAKTPRTDKDSVSEKKVDNKLAIPKPAPDKPAEKYLIQVAALATKEKINELQAKLKAAGIKFFTQTVPTVSGERTRIRIGPFNTKEEAEKMRAKLIKLGLNGTLIPIHTN